MLTDKFKKNADALLHKKLFLLDMDGTIYNENSIFEGTLDFLSQIEKMEDAIFSSQTIPPNP